MPCGIVVVDRQLKVHYHNPFAKRFLYPGANQSPPEKFSELVFFTTDMHLFDMDDCMKNIISSVKRNFHKTLILKNDETERLVYLSANRLVEEEQEFFLFTVSDISDEMDCITHSPGTFGRGEYLISRKIIGRDQKIRDVYRMIALAADSEVNVMITGESGTGKELVADAIHELSERKDRSFVKVNCAALSETLLESELFGHVKGAFTGAYKDKTGKFEQAEGGTIFLDEIGEISPALQVKLLRVIQEKTIEKVGDNKPIRVNMRIVAATNQNLRERIKEKMFREDLFYRLNVFSIHMPPLRERKLDIPLLSGHFVERFNRSTGKTVKGLSRQASKILMEYPWPGNIRELQNAMEHAFVLVQGSLIEVEDLPAEVRNFSGTDNRETFAGTTLKEPGETPIQKSRGGQLRISREQLKAALERHDWNQTRTAEYLDISRVALWKKMKKMGL